MKTSRTGFAAVFLALPFISLTGAGHATPDENHDPRPAVTRIPAGHSEASTSSPGASENREPPAGGTVVVGMKGDFDSFNELNVSDSDALQVIQEMLFMTLTELDENLNVVPYLAESWAFSENEKMLTYTLRKDVTWTDGVPTTAEDVLFTYQMAVHPDVAYPASSRFDLTEGVEILDPFTVRFTFKKAYPDALFDTQIPILPKHILAKIPPKEIAQSDFNRNPVGNGPFRMAEWKANRHIIFESNADFPLGRPRLERVIFSIIPDESVLLTNLMTGSIHVVPSLSPRDFKRIQREPSIQGIEYPGIGYTFLAWNCRRPNWTKEIRRALTHAIDKDEIIKTLLEGYAEPAKGPLPPFAWAYDETLEDIAFDPALSKIMLRDHGWEDADGDGILEREGQDLKLILTTNAESQVRKDAAVMIQAQLKRIGVEATVDMLEFNMLIERIFIDGEFDALLSGWDAGFTVNPTDLYHSRAIENGYNFTGYKNPHVDALLEQGRATTNRTDAKPIWHEFQRIILAECPYTFLFIQEKLAGHTDIVKGIRMDVRGFLSHIREWTILNLD